MVRQEDARSNGHHIQRLLRRLGRHLQRSPGPAAERRTPETAAPTSASGRLILIVGLDGRTCGPLARCLERSGLRTRVAAGKRAALEVLERADTALVIVVGSAGLDLYRALRSASTVPILALDSGADEDRMLSAFEAGVDQFQARPMSCEETVARILALLRRTR